MLPLKMNETTIFPPLNTVARAIYAKLPTLLPANTNCTDDHRPELRPTASSPSDATQTKEGVTLLYICLVICPFWVLKNFYFEPDFLEKHNYNIIVFWNFEKTHFPCSSLFSPILFHTIETLLNLLAFFTTISIGFHHSFWRFDFVIQNHVWN